MTFFFPKSLSGAGTSSVPPQPEGRASIGLVSHLRSGVPAHDWDSFSVSTGAVHRLRPAAPLARAGLRARGRGKDEAGRVQAILVELLNVPGLMDANPHAGHREHQEKAVRYDERAQDEIAAKLLARACE